MLWKIAWRNILHKPLNSILCITLMLFGTGIISLLLIIQNEVSTKFEQDLQNIDIVIGAKGSPLQLVLSSVYHLDAPTGNINLSEVEKIMNYPMVEEAIPLAYGDSHKGYRILGTTKAYLDKYHANIETGRAYLNEMETVLGADVAEKLKLRVGDTFLGTHGEVKEGHTHEGYFYTVTGILKKNNSVLDDLILTQIESVWEVHESHHSHQTVESNNIDNHQEHKDKEITAVLLKCKTKLAVMNIPRIVNQQTSMQAVLPGLEINHLFYMLGIGATTLKLIAGGIMAMAGLSMFFALYARLKERKYELALMRSVGYRLIDLFILLLLEGVLLAIIGYVVGTLLSRIGIYFINIQAESELNFQFTFGYLTEEVWLLLITLSLGIISGLLPAWKATRINVSSTLSEG